MFVQEWLFEPVTHVKGSPFTVIVSPGEVFGRRSIAWGDAVRNGTAGVAAALSVQARDVVGNAMWEGGSKLAVYMFHREAEVLSLSQCTRTINTWAAERLHCFSA